MSLKTQRRNERARRIFFLFILWIGAITYLWVIPIPFRDHSGNLKYTGRGIFSWQEITPSGQVSTNDFNFAITLIVFTIITAVLVFAWCRIGRITYPHGGACNHCGYDVSHTSSTNCPECGKVPWQRKDRWAFWR